MLKRALLIVLYFLAACAAVWFVLECFAEVYVRLQPTRLPAPTEQEIRQVAKYRTPEQKCE